MTARRVAAALLLTLVALVGCKKKPAPNPGDAPQDPVGIGAPNVVAPGPLPNTGYPVPAPAGLSADKVVAVFNQMAEETNADKYPSFAALTHTDWVRMPKGGTVTVDATPKRADLDTTFGKYWAALEARPERIRQKMIRDRADALTKQGLAADQARLQAEKMHQRVNPLKVTVPVLESGSRYMVEADVADAVKGDWNNNGPFVVTGSVKFTESFRVHTNGPLTVKLRGSVGTLLLEANGSIDADLSELTVATVEAKPNGVLLLRTGSSTRTVRVKPGAVPEAAVLSRGATGFKVEPIDDATRQLRMVVVSY